MQKTIAGIIACAALTLTSCASTSGSVAEDAIWTNAR